MKAVKAMVMSGILLLSVVPCALAGPPKWISWRTVRRVDSHALVAVSCPASTLCVAADAAGGITATNDPVATHPTWRRADVDGAAVLTALACPSARFCAATDSAGHVIASTDPGGGKTAWTTASAPTGLDSLSCPSSRFCAAGGTQPFVSADPLGGLSAWRPALPPEEAGCSKLSTCPPATWLVSCPSSSFCAAADTAGNSYTSTQPLSGRWQRGPQAAFYLGLSCTSRRLCVATCLPGYGTTGDQCGTQSTAFDSGTIFTWNPALTVQPATRFSQISRSQLGWVWCGTSTECFAATERGSNPGELYASAAPSGGRGAWARVSRTIGPRVAITGVACPTSSRCIAVDNTGRVLIGSPPATRAQIRMLLREALARFPGGLRRAAATGLSRYAFSFDAPGPGKLKLSFVSLSVRLLNRKPLTLAHLQHAFAGAQTTTLTLDLGPAGRLLNSIGRLAVMAKASFTPPGGASTDVSRRLQIRR